MPKRTSNAKYLKARKEILRDHPVCHWCKRRKATEADHLIEHDAGGSDTIDNLVPSCKQCNGKRGANYVNAKRTRNARARRGVKQPSRKAQTQDRKSVV